MTALLLVYDDVAAARDYFVDGLGFTNEWFTSDEAGVRRAHVRLGDTVLLLGRPGDHGLLRPADAGGVTHLTVISVGDVDERYRRVTSAGVATQGPPTDRPWGREYEVIDPAGYVFNFIK